MKENGNQFEIEIVSQGDRAELLEAKLMEKVNEMCTNCFSAHLYFFDINIDINIVKANTYKFTGIVLNIYLPLIIYLFCKA